MDGLKGFNLLTDDRFDEFVLGVVRGDEGVGNDPVAQDGGAVGNLDHLVDIVRDENHAGAVGDDPAHQRKQLIDALFGQERCRLIEKEDAGIAMLRPFRADVLERPDDGEQGTVDLRNGADLRHRVDLEAEALKGLEGAAPLFVPRNIAGRARRQVADPQVFQDGHAGDQAQVLMHEREAEAAELAGAQGHLHGLAINLQVRTRFRSVEAG